jgi:hypothetical protein
MATMTPEALATPRVERRLEQDARGATGDIADAGIAGMASGNDIVT